MTEKTFSATDRSPTIEEVLPELRFLDGVLQQAWRVETLTNAFVPSSEIQWRDVPSASSPKVGQ